MFTEAISFLDPLTRVSGIRAGWVPRVPGLPVDVDRESAMCLLRPVHEAAVEAMAGGRTLVWWRAEQLHGNRVAVVPGSPTIPYADGLPVVPGVDGLLTNKPGHLLSIYVADCGAIWLADTRTGAIGLLHSGRKGTEQDILGIAIRTMQQEFGTCPGDVVALLGPCIRPPDYDVDFAAGIRLQAQRAGIGNFIDCGLNTASDPAHCYSYRLESGRTGRMMALLVRDFPT